MSRRSLRDVDVFARQVFGVLSFGLPTIVRKSDGSFLLAFWCEEEGITNIRYFTFKVHV